MASGVWLLLGVGSCTATQLQRAGQRGDDAAVIRLAGVDARGRKYIARHGAARTLAGALERSGRREEARAVLEFDARRGGDLKSLLALADLEVRAGLRGVAIAHYVRLSTLAPSMLRNREDICALVDSRADALEQRGEALAAYTDKLRSALLCEPGRSLSDRRFEKELRSRLAPAAKAQATAFRSSTLAPLYPTEHEEQILQALTQARGRGLRSMLDLAVARGYSLGAADVADLLVEEYAGTLSAGVVSDAELRALIGGPLSDGVRDLPPGASTSQATRALDIAQPATERGGSEEQAGPALDRLVAAVSAISGPAGTYAQLRVGRLFVMTVEWEEELDADRLAPLDLGARTSRPTSPPVGNRNRPAEVDGVVKDTVPSNERGGPNAGEDPRRARLESMLRDALAVLAKAGDSDPKALVAMARALWLSGDESEAQMVLRQAISLRRAALTPAGLPGDAPRGGSAAIDPSDEKAREGVSAPMTLASDGDLAALHACEDLELLRWYRLLARMQDATGKSVAGLAIERAVLARALTLDAKIAAQWREESVSFELIRGAPSRALALATGHESSLSVELSAALATAVSLEGLLREARIGPGNSAARASSRADLAHALDRQEAEQVVEAAALDAALDTLLSNVSRSQQGSASSLSRAQHACARPVDRSLLADAAASSAAALGALDQFESDTAFRCTMGLLGEALHRGGHQPLASALADRLSHLPELDWNGINEDLMSISLAAQQPERASYLLREAAAVDIDARATWLRAAVRAHSGGSPSLFATAVRETIFASADGSSVPLRRALLVHALTQGTAVSAAADVQDLTRSAQTNGEGARDPSREQAASGVVDAGGRAPAVNTATDAELKMAVQEHLRAVPPALRARELGAVLIELAALEYDEAPLGASQDQVDSRASEAAAPWGAPSSLWRSGRDSEMERERRIKRYREVLRAVVEPAHVVWVAEALAMARDLQNASIASHADAVSSVHAPSPWDARLRASPSVRSERHDSRLGALVLGDSASRARALTSLLHNAAPWQRESLLVWLESSHLVRDPKAGLALLIPDAWTLARLELGFSLEAWARLGAPPMLGNDPSPGTPRVPAQPRGASGAALTSETGKAPAALADGQVPRSDSSRGPAQQGAPK